MLVCAQCVSGRISDKLMSWFGGTRREPERGSLGRGGLPILLVLKSFKITKVERLVQFRSMFPLPRLNVC